jgi:hypothetical protein
MGVALNADVIFSCPRPAVLDLSKVPDFQANNAVVGFLDHSGHPLLRRPPRLQKAGEIGALPQLGNAKLHRSGEGLPIPVAITVALRESVGGSLAVRRAGLGAHLRLHQRFGGEADHAAQDIASGSSPRTREGTSCHW